MQHQYLTTYTVTRSFIDCPPNNLKIGTIENDFYTGVEDEWVGNNYNNDDDYDDYDDYEKKEKEK